jgi:hypothetical protein
MGCVFKRLVSNSEKKIIWNYLNPRKMKLVTYWLSVPGCEPATSCMCDWNDGEKKYKYFLFPSL